LAGEYLNIHLELKRIIELISLCSIKYVALRHASGCNDMYQLPRSDLLTYYLKVATTHCRFARLIFTVQFKKSWIS